MDRERPSLKNKLITTIALVVIFLGILIILITRYFIIDLISPTIVNKILAILALSTGISVIISSLIGLWLSGIIIKPILALNDACRKIVSGDFDARVDVESLKCWEIKGCNNENCPAYGHSLEKCWFVTGTLCMDGKPSETYTQKIGDCKKCKVYNLYQSDEVRELSDTFNYMARHLKELIEKLNTAYKEIEKEVLKKTEELTLAHNELVVKHEEVKKHEKELEVINKELDSFVYTVSHDLKEPLRGIETFSRFILDDYWDKLDEEGKDYLKRISRAANRMKLFIDDLLALSRVSRIKNPYQTFEPEEIIKDVLKRLDFRTKEKDCKIKVDDSLPVLYGDKTKLKEVFYNLVSNAVKYNNKKPEIEIGAKESGVRSQESGVRSQESGVRSQESGVEEEVVFFVKDNGIGIKEEDFERVFEPFKRLHKRDEYEGGIGIGLAIVKKVIEEHRGKIWVESKLGEGSTFYFSLPKN